MLEDFEALSDFPNMESCDRLSDSQLEYIEELLPIGKSDLLVNRIDEMSECYPPKAIDANKEIAALIEPMKEQISSIYLEAPQDHVQVEKISDIMTRIEGLEYSEWKELSFEQRVGVLQEVENESSKASHRPTCKVSTESLGEGHYGYYSTETKGITINSDYICSNSYNDYKEALDTIIHEGRHAYQYYNLTEREVHPRQGDISNWKSNEFEYGYQDARTQGYAAYYLQPQEADARAFAEDVLKQYSDKLA